MMGHLNAMSSLTHSYGAELNEGLAAAVTRVWEGVHTEALHRPPHIHLVGDVWDLCHTNSPHMA
eukprot:704831-Prorocentrum_lima.AAC.1